MTAARRAQLHEWLWTLLAIAALFVAGLDL